MKISEWIKSDLELYNTIMEIESTTKSQDRQAEMAFNKICELYSLPKYPEDLDNYLESLGDKQDGEIRSVYEEYALIKFLNPNANKRTLVLSAIYNVKNFFAVDIKDVISKMESQFGSVKFIGIEGEMVNTDVIPVKNVEKGLLAGCFVVYTVLDTAGNRR
ncbi:hypothetical protein FNO01nite_29690 [Flavobacterium noncentrifugens]|nr:hypothetical protein [Flavobacterium noncentrifugens]GEP52297.1 hypothetical protein FNO01nite_29690 [Flavobacterium noncentrifugens]